MHFSALRLPLLASCLHFISALPTHGDIYEWEWIDPLDHAQGKQESTTLVPDGAGRIAAPKANFRDSDLSMAYLIKKDLTEADFSFSTLTNADFADAVVNEADFRDTTSRGFTAPQFYSTASYQSGDLSGIRLGSNDLTGWNFAGKNLTNSFFYQATLTDSDFTGAVVSGGYFSETTARGFTAAQFYSTISYQTGELSEIALGDNDLTGWNFSGKDLTNAYFGGSTLRNADFTGAVVSGGRFTNTTSGGFTSAQLYSTASYQSGDLTRIRFIFSDLTGWNLAGKNLTGAFFQSGTVRDANFASANLTDAYFGLSTLADADFTDAIMTNAIIYADQLAGANFTGANLSGATFRNTRMANANFSDSIIRGAILMNIGAAGTGSFTAQQLYSTASYQTGDLTGIGFNYSDLRGWNFAGKNLTDASFAPSRLTNTDFTDAVVSGADFGRTTSRGFTAAQLYSTASYQTGDLSGIGLGGNDLTGWNFAGMNLTGAYFQQATLTDADFTGADTRGASELAPTPTTIVRNMISPDGRIVGGLHLEAAETMRLWDYDGETPLPIVIEDGMSIDPSATLHAVFDADAWGSTIAFEAGVDVALGGTLLLEFADEVNLTEQIGRTIDLFDWDGVSPTGEFTVESPFQWDLSELYSSGEVTLLGVGGAIPEPATLVLLLTALAMYAVAPTSSVFPSSRTR